MSPPSPELNLKIKDDRILSISLLTSSPSLKAEYIAGKSLKIRCTDRPGAQEFAEFPFSVDLRMSFHWSKAAQSSSWRTIRSSLRDCAIKIEFLDAPDHLVVLRKRVEDHATPLGLMSRPLTWDTEGVFSESKNLVFIDQVFVDGIPAATANHNKGTYLRKTEDLAEWTLLGEESKKKVVSIRLDRKDGQVHVHPEYDQKYLNPQKVDHDLARIAQEIRDIGREIQRVEFELSVGNMTEERRRSRIEELKSREERRDGLESDKTTLELIRDLRTIKVNMVLSTKIGGVKIDVKRIGKFRD